MYICAWILYKNINLLSSSVAGIISPYWLLRCPECLERNKAVSLHSWKYSSAKQQSTAGYIAGPAPELISYNKN